jgi:hypothetical protein
VNRWAKSDSGHLPPLTASTPHSSSTRPLRIAAQRNRRITPVSGSTTMLPARMAQTMVCKSLIVVSILGSSGFHENY